MITIDLGEEKSFEVTFKGQTHTLREPTVAEVDMFKDQAQGDGVETLLKFLTVIGMPEDVVKNMPMTKAKLLIDTMMDELAKKK